MQRYRLIIVLTVLLAAGFLATSLVSYYVSKMTIHEAIVDRELPLTADNIYSEIQKDLVRPVFISSMMASNTFLRDWVIDGERDIDKVSKYLQDVQTSYGAFISFFVSEATQNYYYGKGLLKQVKQDEPRDVWYYRVRAMQQPYEINVDRDLAHADTLTIFVNYRVFDYANRYIGTTGVGLTVDSVQKLINNYQARYQRSVYFVNHDGVIMLSGSPRLIPGSNLHQAAGLGQIASKVLGRDSGSYEYQLDDATHLINARYLPELKWYLVVEKSESEATAAIRKTLYLNILICLVVTLLVIVLTQLSLQRYQAQLEAMATTDSLTGLPNRRAFGVVVELLVNESTRNENSVAVILLDLDHFKQVNDQYGHLGGDHVLVSIAAIIKSCVRAADFVCRWGGEEFLIVVKNLDQHNVTQFCEKIRLAIEGQQIDYKNQQIRITASLGAAIAYADEKIEHVLDRADHAMYRAKAEGRNRVVVSGFDIAT